MLTLPDFFYLKMFLILKDIYYINTWYFTLNPFASFEVELPQSCLYTLFNIKISVLGKNRQNFAI